MKWGRVLSRKGDGSRSLLFEGGLCLVKELE